jgi:SAM-dependent methyltransferase
VTADWREQLGQKDSRYRDDPEALYKIGDYEVVYQMCDDPWGQETAVFRSPIKHLVAFRVAEKTGSRVIDLGCGSGVSSELLRVAGHAEVLGIDVAPTAVEQARQRHPDCTFEVADATEIGSFGDFNPTAITMFGITWCILDTFETVIDTIRKSFSGVTLYHTMTMYGKGVQTYGTEYFTDLQGLLPYFGGMEILETVKHEPKPLDGTNNTLVVARVL